MDGSFLAAAAGSSPLMKGMDFAMNYFMTDQQNKANKELWKEMVEYNKPEHQVQLLREAGLNPALMYGKGVSAGIAGAPPTMQKVQPPEISEDISATQQVVNQDLVRENLENQVEKSYWEKETAKWDYEATEDLSKLGLKFRSYDSGDAVAGAQAVRAGIRLKEENAGKYPRTDSREIKKELENDPFFKKGVNWSDVGSQLRMKLLGF